MPKRIADTGGPTVTLMADDGNIIEVVRDVADRIVPEDIGMSVPPGALPPTEVPDIQDPPIGGAPSVQPSPEAVQSLGVAPFVSKGASPFLGVQPEPETGPPPGEIDLAPQPQAQAPQQQLEQQRPRPQGWLAAHGSGMAAQAEGVLEQAASKQSGLREQGEAMGEARAEQARIAAARERERAEEDATIEQQVAIKSQMLDERRSAKVDPGRFWASKETGQKVLAGIGVALAGLGMAMKGRGGENPALDLLMKAVDDDVKLQQANIAKMGEDIAMQRGLISDFQQQFKTREGRYQAGIAERIAEVKAITEEIGLKTASDIVAPVAKQRVGELAVLQSQALRTAEQAEVEGQKWEAEFEIKGAQFEERKRHARAQEGIGWGGLALRRKKIEADLGIAQAKADQVGADAVRTGTILGLHGKPIGISRYRGDTSLMLKEQKGLTDLGIYRREVGKLQAMLEQADREYKGWMGDSDVVASTLRRRIQGQMTLIAYAAAQSVDSGKLSDKDVEVWAAAYGKDIRGWLQKSDPKKLTKDRLESAETKLRSSLVVHGFDEKTQVDPYIRQFAKDDAEFKLEFKSPAPETRAETSFKQARSPGDPQARASSVASLSIAAGKGDKEAQEKLKNLAESSDAVGQMAKKNIGIFHNARPEMFPLTAGEKFTFGIE